MESRKKTTIQDIAERANVSISTVSRVVNGTAPVAEDTRRQVLTIIEEMGYRPNMFAQGLAGGQSMMIGVLTQHISSPLYDHILRGINDEIQGTGYSTIFADGYWNAQKEEAALQAFVDRRVDGLIVLAGQLSDAALLRLHEQTPMIVIGRNLPGMEQDCILLDNFEASRMAARYLTDAGHQRIAYITGLPSHRDAFDRRLGYVRAMAEAGIDLDPQLMIEGDFTEPAGILAVEMLLTRGRSFSAIMCGNDQMAYGARLALYRRGIRVPEDISLVGFDDQPQSAYQTPPLTSAGWPAIEIGEAAANALLNRLKDKPYTMPVFQPRLYVRESVARSR